jgi:hypothetical protein
MSVKKRKCKNCGEYTENFIKVPAGVFCSIESAYKFARTKQQKQRDKQIAKSKRVKVKKIKAERRLHRANKERIKPKAKWLAELQAVFNKYVRLRDINDGCISCDKPSGWHGQWHAGHYYSRGHSSSLRFNLWNCHRQCSVCNNYLSGNIGEYTPKLINKIGQTKFNYLLSHKSNVASYDVEWIKRALRITRKAIKTLEKRNNHD